MLATIAIIAILAGLALGTLFLSQQAARREKTRSLISKLDTQMALRWESYRTRRLPIQMQPNVQPDEAAVRQLWARRALMRMELPEKYSDLIWADPVGGVGVDIGIPPNLTLATPSLTRTYQRRVLQAINQYRTAQGEAPISWGDSELGAEIARLEAENQTAELLYLIMTTGVETDATGRKLFRHADIGDTDGDGMLEFLDGWGNPIRWIRWPAGFVSDRQPMLVDGSGNPSRLEVEHHDPFDPRQVDSQGWPPDSPAAPNTSDTYTGTDPFLVIERGFRTFPLIVSAGPDGEFGLMFAGTDVLQDDFRHLDPYAFFQVTITIGGIEETRWVQRGVWYQPTFGGHFDNIHNHMLGSP